VSTNIEQIETLFNRAIEFRREERGAFLAGACGQNTVLMARVQALLQAHDADAAILADRPRSEPGAGSAAEKPGDRIGHYKLLQQIGEGGCGVVYMAEQEEPVRRLVALKVIKLGMDTRKVVARFEAERQALALMDHPNIAKVLDAGTTQAGRPFFVMELVRGVKITDYCEEHNLSTTQRLDLVIQCCRAIQHAHQKGIIHRDVKPSNVLVTVHDGVPVPKVIDFGIAKAIEGRLTDQTLFTAFEQFIGTPAYMSPEQAQLNGLDVDTRTDIYSLGVLIYELLTGQTPFDAKELLMAGLDEMRKTIREKEPLRPSTRLTLELTSAKAKSLQNRSLNPGSGPGDPAGAGRGSHEWIARKKELVHVLRGDLDWIVMKCLEKDRTRRYETANGLAMDLQRHLTGEPVVARPPSNLYRFQKLVRRNRLAFSAAAAVALALVLGIVGSTSEAVRARRAEREQVRLRGEADRARAGEMTQRAAAEQHLYDALLGEAHAKQLSGRAGQRFESLDAITKAATIHSTSELSDEAVSAFALTDLREGKHWRFVSHWRTEGMRFDDPFVLCASRTPTGITIRRVVNDEQVKFLPVTDIPDLLNGFLPRRFDHQSHYFAASCLTREGWRCRVWDITRESPLMLDLPGFANPDFSPDGKAVAMLNPDRTVSIKEITTGKDRIQFQVEGMPSLFRFSPDGAELAGLEPGNSTVRIWDVGTGQVVTVLQSSGNLTFFAWNQEASLLATGGQDGSISLWDLPSGRLRSRMEGHESRVTGLTFSHQGDLLASASWDTTLRLWDVARGQQLVVYRTQDTDLHFSPDDQILAYAIAGETAKLLQMAHRTGYRRLSGSAELPKSWGVDFSPDGRLLATCTSGGIVLWDTMAGKEVGFIRGPHCRAVHFQTNDGLSLLGSTEGGFYRWPLQIRSGADDLYLRVEPPHVLLPQEAFRYSALDPGGSKIVGSRADGSPPVILDLENPNSVMRLRGHPGASSVAWAPSGRWVATGSWKGTGVNVYEASSGRLIRELPVKGSANIAFSPDSKWLATAEIAGFKLWNASSWELWPQSLPSDQISEINPLTFSPDGRLLALVYPISEIRIVKVPNFEVVATLRAPTLASLSSICFSPDGTKLAVLEWGGQVNVWDLQVMREELRKLNLDWNFPAFAAANHSAPGLPIVRVDDGPFSKEELAKAIRPRGPNTSTNQIDLTEYYNAPLTESWHSPREAHNDLSELGLGVRKVGDVEFDIRGLIQIGMTAANRLSYPSHVYDIPVQRRCRRLHFLHAAAYAAAARPGDELGSYIFHYVDGREVELPIITGKHMGEWWSQPAEQDMSSIIAWTGSNPAARKAGHSIRLFKTVWENPFPDIPIRHLDFTSDKPTPGQPFLVAITAEP
jgi:serine/threonine protein kinase/WD40 repeat protein